MKENIRLNKNQQLAAEYEDKHILVLAGAGTGKTLTIIARAEHLIRKGVDPNCSINLSFSFCDISISRAGNFDNFFNGFCPIGKCGN